MAKKEQKVRWISTGEAEAFSAATFDLHQYARMMCDTLDKFEGATVPADVLAMLNGQLRRALDRFEFPR